MVKSKSRIQLDNRWSPDNSENIANKLEANKSLQIKD